MNARTARLLLLPPTVILVLPLLAAAIIAYGFLFAIGMFALGGLWPMAVAMLACAVLFLWLTRPGRRGTGATTRFRSVRRWLLFPVLFLLGWGLLQTNIQEAAVDTLGLMGPRATPLLAHALKIGSHNAQGRALIALRENGWHDPSAVPALMAYLQHGDAWRTDDAAEILGNIGADGAPAAPLLLDIKDGYSARAALAQIGEPAVPALLNAASGTDRDKRLRAIEDLGDIRSSTAVPTLIGLLNDPDSQISYAAEQTLSKLAPEAKTAIAPMIRFGTQRDYVNDRVCEDVARFGGAAVPELMDLFRNKINAQAEFATRTLILMAKQGAPIVSECAAALKRPNPGARINAALTLNELGKRAAPAVQDLIDALADDDAVVRGSAARALGSIGLPAAARAVAPLELALNNAQPDERTDEARALAILSPNNPQALAVLQQAIDAADASVVHRAAVALKDLPHNPETVALLIRAMKRGDIDTAADALASFGPDARAAAGDLRQLAASSPPEILPHILTALFAVDRDSPETRTVLVAALRNPAAVNKAADLLGTLGPAARSSVPDLQQAMSHTKEWPRYACAEALCKIDPPAGVAAMIQELDDSNSYVRSGAVETLGKLGPTAAAAAQRIKQAGAAQQVPVGDAAIALYRINGDPTLLIAAVKGADSYQGTKAVEFLETLGPAAAPAIPALIDIIRNRSLQQDSAVVALGKIGPAAKAAVPTLLGADAGDFGYIEHAKTQAALHQIDPDALHRAKMKTWAIPTAAIAGYVVVLALLWMMWRRLPLKTTAPHSGGSGVGAAAEGAN